MRADWEAKITECEELIRLGKTGKARLNLTSLRSADIPRFAIGRLARIACRVGSFDLGLKWLFPVIHPEHPGREPATNFERITYASLLSKVGATNQAIGILEPLKDESSQALLNLAFAHMQEWNYRDAGECLRNYLRLPDPSEYERMIAIVNLSASYICLGQYEQACPLLESALVETREKDWMLLHGNVLELSTQLAVRQRNWGRAQTCLDQAKSECDSNENSAAALFIRKWQALLNLEKDGPSDKNLYVLDRVREEASSLGHWETVRYCDFRKAVAVKDNELFLRVYFGTPHLQFREQMKELAWDGLVIPNEFKFALGSEYDSPDAEKYLIDVQMGEERAYGNHLKPGQGMHRLLLALSADLYRPALLAGIFAQVFPEEHFHPTASPDKTFKLITRLRSWFQKNGIPLEISLNKSRCQLTAKGPCTLLLRQAAEIQKRAPVSPLVIQIKRLKEHWPDEPFSAREASDVLGLSVRAAQILLRKARDVNEVHCLGRGRSQKYLFTPGEKDAA